MTTSAKRHTPKCPNINFDGHELAKAGIQEKLISLKHLEGRRDAIVMFVLHETNVEHTTIILILIRGFF